MSTFDKISLALSLLGLGSNIVLALMPAEWREMHKNAVIAGHMTGFVLIGVGLYVLGLSVLPPEWGAGMLPKASIVLGVILLIGGGIWQVTGSTKAQTSSSASQPVIGAEISGNSQVSPAADISVSGTAGQGPVVGADINATGCPGQSVTGLKVTQSGPGTGLKVTATGDGSSSVTGMRVTVGSKPGC